ncbi:hypothetical protein CEXT_793381 [Caerostris extrusa]|uniref:Uncharacterized protein n=1 Tax=Caerostris extrusa TaxID=172846 RepID=A0AAV4SRJ2_CAEEX|nr:hypothetical protein CEXT_793381 [Caerostris extrusa]
MQRANLMNDPHYLCPRHLTLQRLEFCENFAVGPYFTQRATLSCGLKILSTWFPSRTGIERELFTLHHPKFRKQKKREWIKETIKLPGKSTKETRSVLAQVALLFHVKPYPHGLLDCAPDLQVEKRSFSCTGARWGAGIAKRHLLRAADIRRSTPPLYPCALRARGRRDVGRRQRQLGRLRGRSYDLLAAGARDWLPRRASLLPPCPIRKGGGTD